MRVHSFQLVNVFATGSLFSGNALCVFEDGTGLTDGEMQALALQFSLSETTFLLPSEVADARVRIFTPSFELPFAGHPILGTAQVLRSLRGLGDRVGLETNAGVIPVQASADGWTLQANAPRCRPVRATRSELAAMLGIAEADIADNATWVDTGSEQLVVPLASVHAVLRCKPDAKGLAQHASNDRREGLAYVWAHQSLDQIVARFFFLKCGSVAEDPGTGSACANLGGWLLTTGSELPRELAVRQGEQLGRACSLKLRVTAAREIFVTGSVVPIGRGTIEL